MLIKCIIGLLRPDSGRIEVFGENVPGFELHRARSNARPGWFFVSKQCPVRFHDRAREPRISASAALVETPQQDVDERVHEVLQSVGLAHTTEMMPAELSGGMRKRIALARTLILKPAIILYDEPTTGLDPITGMEIIELIQQVQQEYRTASLVISHDLKLAQIAAERIIMLIDGTCYAQGTFSELQASSDPKVRAFFD
ncbi:MAG: ATP-binding cassette domain-containing protein [Lewinellaceae bacterium]|nr:ATP-binding cassette domain-containing protein [Lewinellaceae bacterium]